VATVIGLHETFVRRACSQNRCRIDRRPRASLRRRRGEGSMTNALIDTVGKSAPAQAGSPEHEVLVQQAFAAIEAATTVEDLTRIRDQWHGIAAYAAKAKKFEIKSTAEEIKARAERKLGQMIQEQKETIGLNKGGRPKTGLARNLVSTKPTLAEAGIDKNLAHRARRQAAKSEEEFEADIAEKRVAITERKRKRKTSNRPAARRATAKGKTKAAAEGKSRIRHVDIIAAWNDAPLEERTRAMDGIGLKPFLTALPQPWIPLIEKWLVEVKVEAPTSEIAEQTTKVGDGLDIPDYLRREKWVKAEAVE
jgi:hypothetical protein